MKTGWKTLPLGEVCTLQRGFDLPTQNRVPGEFPLVSSSGITDTHNDGPVCGPGVVTGRSGSIGNVFFIERNFWPLNTTLYIRDFHGNDPRFVFHLLNQFDLKRFSGGTGVPTLNRNDVHGEMVKIPSALPEQQRIVAILDEAFNGIATAKANAEKNLQNAQALFESYLQPVFSGSDENWKQTTFGAEIDLLVGFAFKSNQYTDAADGVNLLRGDNIVQGSLRWEDVKKWPASDTATYAKYQLAVGDVVLAMDRPWIKAGLKRAMITSDDLPCLLVQRTACLRGGPNLESRFLMLLIGSMAFTRHILGVQTGSGVPHISGQQIKDFEFARPPIGMQRNIASNLEKLRAETQRLESIYQQKLAALNELKKSLLHQAFTGAL